MENYTFIEKIGKGTHGIVYLLEENDTKNLVVCKIVNEKNLKYAMREIKILSQISNKRIIKLLKHLKEKKDFYLILEYANNHSLDILMNQNKENKISLKEDKKYHKFIWNFLSQISEALYYLHNKNIIHRDIKPANILVNKMKIRDEDFFEFKICDFSLSTIIENKSNNIVGTPFYMAPEIIKKEDYTHNIDIWSLGIILFEMISFQRPFNGRTKKDLQLNIVNKEITEIENLKENDVQLECIILNCLNKNKLERLNSYELKKMDKTKYYIAINEIKYRDLIIKKLEDTIKENQIFKNYLPSPDELKRKSYMD